jgi:beta-lactamase regulating signal transducer with metallopeptidase domain
MNPEFYTASERLLSATANGLYQGVLVAALAALVLRMIPRTNAATRHAIWGGALVFVTALIPAHLLFSHLQHSKLRQAQRASHSAAIEALASDVEAAIVPAVGDGGTADQQPAESVTDTAGDAPSPAVALESEGSNQDNDSEQRTRQAFIGNIWLRLKSAIVDLLSFNFETPINLPHWLCSSLVFAWVLLAGIRGSQVVRRLIDIRRAKNASSGPGGDLQTLFDKLRNALPARRNVRLRMSDTHSGAVLLGFAHPVVLLPADIAEDLAAADVEHVLRHELAHVVRWDDWGNLMQQAVEAALFFHPAVWWISRKLSLEREIACDDHVLEASDRPRAYALTLANVASRMNQCRHLLSPGVSNNNSQLQQRITMILNTNRDRSSRLATRRLGVFTTATALLAVLAVTAGPRLVLAQSPAPAPSPAPSADGTPAAPDSQDESGPRSKDGNDNDNNNKGPAARALVLQAPPAPAAPEAPATPPTPAVAAVVVAAPTPVAAISTDAAVSDPSAPDVAPAPPRPPKHPGRHSDMSVEERLDRIERILKELQDRGVRRNGNAWAYSAGPGPGQPGIVLDPNVKVNPDVKINPDWAFKFADEQAKRAEEQAKRAEEQAKRSAEAGERAAEAGQRAAERAAEAGQRAAEASQRSVEKAMRDMEKFKTEDFQRMQQDLQQKLQDSFRNFQGENPNREIEALRGARDSLQREMENLSRQIRQLEHAEKHINKHKDGKDGKDDDSDDDSDNGPKVKPDGKTVDGK